MGYTSLTCWLLGCGAAAGLLATRRWVGRQAAKLPKAASHLIALAHVLLCFLCFPELLADLRVFSYEPVWILSCSTFKLSDS